MQSLFLFLCVHCAFFMYAQESTCKAVVYYKYDNTIFLLDQPGGEIVSTFKNDLGNENFINLTLLVSQEDYFKVEIKKEMDEIIQHGWIKKGSFIGAFLRDEKSSTDLILYNSPDEKMKTQLIVDWKSTFITIKDFSNEWVEVIVEHEGQFINGWIKASKLCANNYSTCS